MPRTYAADWTYFSLHEDWKMVVYGQIIPGQMPAELRQVDGFLNLTWLHNLPVDRDLTTRLVMPKVIELAAELRDAFKGEEDTDPLGPTVLKNMTAERLCCSPAVPPNWWQPVIAWLEHVANGEIPWPQYLMCCAAEGMAVKADAELGYAMAYGRDNRHYSQIVHAQRFLVRLSVFLPCDVVSQSKLRCSFENVPRSAAS